MNKQTPHSINFISNLWFDFFIFNHQFSRRL